MDLVKISAEITKYLARSEIRECFMRSELLCQPGRAKERGDGKISLRHPLIREARVLASDWSAITQGALSLVETCSNIILPLDMS